MSNKLKVSKCCRYCADFKPEERHYCKCHTPKKERKIKGWVLTNALLTIPEQTGSFLDCTVWLKKPPKFSAIYTEITITYQLK